MSCDTKNLIEALRAAAKTCPGPKPVPQLLDRAAGAIECLQMELTRQVELREKLSSDNLHKASEIEQLKSELRQADRAIAHELRAWARERERADMAQVVIDSLTQKCEGYLLKLKRFEDSEAVVVGFEEKLTNTNTQERDELGHAKRSKVKVGMVPAGTLGALRVRRPDGVEFSIGSGFDDAFRTKAWEERETLVGRLVKYRHQPHGALEAPRFPVFLGFRHEDDC